MRAEAALEALFWLAELDDGEFFVKEHALDVAALVDFVIASKHAGILQARVPRPPPRLLAALAQRARSTALLFCEHWRRAWPWSSPTRRPF